MGWGELKQMPVVNIIYRFLIDYQAPVNLTYFWNFGVLAVVCLGVQIISGVALVMHYAPDVSLAFSSVEHIMRDVNNGWLIRYIHANGASMFFIVVYLHMFRGMYYTSYMYPRQLLWDIGVIILLVMIITAFMGYVLPWGQMSFWAATVITNLFSAIPKVGADIVVWLWGGFSVGNATLNRFFSLHYLFPFVLAGLVIIHLILLHEHGSNNPLGVNSDVDNMLFSPYYLIKDLYGLLLFLIFFAVFLFFMPNVLGHPDNYIMANPLVTPSHIVPEWYFLSFYAILRSIPDKLAGVIGMVLAIVTLLFLPVLGDAEVRSIRFRPLSRIMFWFIVVVSVILGWIGSQMAKYPYVGVGQFAMVAYFVYFYVIVPMLVAIERFMWGNRWYMSKSFLTRR